MGDPGEPRIDDIPNSRDGQGGFGDVGGHDDFAAGDGAEDPGLLVGGQPGEQRQDNAAPVVVAGQQVAGLADILLGRHEDQDVPKGPTGLKRVDHPQRLVDVGLFSVFGPIRVRRPVVDRHRIHPAGDLDDRGLVEECRKFGGVDGRRGDDQLELRPLRQNGFQHSEDKIDVEAALMGLIHDQGVVGSQLAVALRLGQQDPVGHDFDVGFGPGGVLKADFMPHHTAGGRAEFFGQAAGQAGGGDPAGLGAPDLALQAATGRQAEFGDLGRLARPGLPGDNRHGMAADGGDNLVAVGENRKIGVVAQFGQIARPLAADGH